MKVKFLIVSGLSLALAGLMGLVGCGYAQPTAKPPVILQFPTISGQTETAVFESTQWTPTSTGTITLIPTATNTLAPSNTSRPATRTATQPTATATLQFSLTPSSTFTTTVTPHTTKTASMTPTYAIITKTPPTWGCKLQSADPRGYKGFHANDEFDGHFTVKNTGGSAWTTGKVTYRFINGTALNKRDSLYVIANNVAVGDTLSATIDMKAPGIPGRYTSTWSFEYSQSTICLITFAITVLDN